MAATELAIGAMWKIETIPLHRERIEGEKGVGKQLPYPSQTLDAFGGLNGA